MTNREVYQVDPTTRKLVNEGVANVNDEINEAALRVLRYELETFVCDGQYEKGMRDILETYLKNIEQSQQPSVWVSGFYGSGKSHLVKMLRSLWVDTTFLDGATARGIAKLPQSITDLFVELNNQSKRHGSLFAASGTLGSSADGSVRLAILSIIFKAAGLPEKYSSAQFIMWLKDENLLEQIKTEVENNGYDWQKEIDGFHANEIIHEALCKHKPNLFSSPFACMDALIALYPPDVRDVSNEEMIKAIKKALTKDGKFPLSLIVLDEVQQYIGESSDRSIAVQEMVEAITKNIGGKLMFIGTGQTAVTGTANLARLQGRFTIRVELSDTDVDTVIRKVILAKKPETTTNITSIMQTNLGEISRHLSNSNIGHRNDDIAYFAQDYPILPVRRRFWENALRILDQTGTDSQLRNQLSMIHKVIQSNIDKKLGTVVSADYLYFDSAEKLLQARVLPRKVHEKTMTWIEGTEDEKLMARASGLVFLINKLTSFNKEIGIKATVDTLADLMVEDLSLGSSELRSKLPNLLEKCELLMKVGDEFRIQTEESTAWNDEYLSQQSQLSNKAYELESNRTDRIRKKFSDTIKRLSLTQGDSKVSREITSIFDQTLPRDSDKKVCIWIRDGWSIDENSVRAEARQAGSESSTIFIFIPKRSPDDFRHHLISYKAASTTLDVRGVPNTPEGVEARAAMETQKQTSDGKINAILNDAFSGIRVFQAGGNEITGQDILEMILEATHNSLLRLYPNFSIADHSGWAKVYEKAKQGAPDSLQAIGFEDEPSKNMVCKYIYNFIGGGAKGIDIRTNFSDAPYGWSQDAIDGALQILQVAGLIKALDERGQGIDFKSLDRKFIGKTTFKIEATTITTAQRIQIRKVLQKLSISAQNGEESAKVPEFVQKLKELALKSGGDAPKPELPNMQLIESIRTATGNEQLLAIYSNKDELITNIEEWSKQAEQIEKRVKDWDILAKLSIHAKNLKDSDVIIAQIDSIINQRLLLSEPNPIEPLSTQLTQMLRDELNILNEQYTKNHTDGINLLDNDENWEQLEQEQKHQLLNEQQLTNMHTPRISVGTTNEIIKTLENINISSLKDKVIALTSKFQTVATKAAQLLEPEVKTITLSRRTLKAEDEINSWLEEVKEQLNIAIKNGPIRIG